MSPLPSLTPREVVAAFKRAGFVERRQRGSHLIMSNPQSGQIISIPLHTRDMPQGTLRSIIKQAGYTEAEFKALL